MIAHAAILYPTRTSQAQRRRCVGPESAIPVARVSSARQKQRPVHNKKAPRENLGLSPAIFLAKSADLVVKGDELTFRPFYRSHRRDTRALAPSATSPQPSTYQH